MAGMNKIYLLCDGVGYVDGLLTDNFATDEEGLKRIALRNCFFPYGRVVVDLAAETVRIMDKDGDVAAKFHIWTITRTP